MLILNFSHPLTKTQLGQIETLSGEKITEIRQIPAQFDHAAPFCEQIRALVDNVGLTSDEWQILPILIIPPAYNFGAVTLIAELHGRMGYFPPIVRIRPVEKTATAQFEVAEIIPLQIVRESARSQR